MAEIRERIALYKIKRYWLNNNISIKDIKKRYKKNRRRTIGYLREFIEATILNPDENMRAELNRLNDLKESEMSDSVDFTSIRLSKISYNVKSPKNIELSPVKPSSSEKNRIFNPTYSSCYKRRTISRTSTRCDSRSFVIASPPVIEHKRKYTVSDRSEHFYGLPPLETGPYEIKVKPKITLTSIDAAYMRDTRSSMSRYYLEEEFEKSKSTKRVTKTSKRILTPTESYTFKKSSKKLDTYAPK